MLTSTIKYPISAVTFVVLAFFTMVFMYPANMHVLVAVLLIPTKMCYTTLCTEQAFVCTGMT
jgi:hypothetical protein